MSLEQSIEEFRHKGTNDGICPFAKLIEKLSDADKKALANAIEKRLPDVTLANALRKEGYKIAEISIAQHRKGLCRCKSNG
jgi:hypothetical protein